VLTGVVTKGKGKRYRYLGDVYGGFVYHYIHRKGIKEKQQDNKQAHKEKT